MNDFDECLERSRGLNGLDDVDAILAFFDGGAVVREASREEERRGIDYVARLDGGAVVFFDAKRRMGSFAKYWRSGPEVALEIWSVCPEPGKPGKVGWALDEAKATHYILFTYNPQECAQRFIVPFQLMRVAFKANRATWEKRYKTESRQPNKRGARRWCSSCVFVPVRVMWDAMREASMLTYTYTADTASQHLAASVAAKPGDPPAAPVQTTFWQ